MKVKRVWGKFLFNKYFVVVFFFLIWIVFFDEASLINQWSYSRFLTDLKKQIEYYRGEIERMTYFMRCLEEDTRFLERYARTRYFMRERNEVIFIIRINKEK